MKEKRTVYIVEKDSGIFKVFDTLAEANVYMVHEYLKWFDTDTNFDHEERAYVEDMFYLYEAEYGGE